MFGIAERFIAVTASGGVITFPATDVYSIYYFGGTATLSSPLTVSATTPTTSTYYKIFYNANLTTSGANVASFFGTTLTAAQALAGKLIIEATYNSEVTYGTVGWKVVVTPGTGWNETHNLQVSFSAAQVGDFKIKMGYAGTVTEIYAYAIEAIGAVDAGTIIPKNNAGSTMATGTITYPLSSLRGTAFTVNPSSNNTFIAGDFLTLTTAKATAGGEVLLSIKTLRTP